MKLGVVYTAAVLYLGLLYVTDSCNVEFVVTDSPSNITSPGYPSWIPRNLTCWWKVLAADSDSNVVVDVMFSDIGSSCNYNNLTLYDGFNSSAPRIIQLCGTQRGSYRSTGRSLYILFRTGSLSNFGNTGFALKVYQSPKCGGQLIASPENAMLISPGYPARYFNNLMCTWIITAENENDTVVLDVIDSEIELETTCSYDFVTINNGNVTDHDFDALLGKFCGSVTPSFQSSKDQLTIVFKTDSSVVRSGFKMRYRSVEAGNCNKSLTVGSNQLYFVSPGYPDGYYSDMECVWTITSTSLQSILLDVITSEIDDSENCANASVTVYSGVMATELGSFCGNSTPSYISDMWYMTVVFSSNEVTMGKGFRIGYQSIQTIITTTRDPSCGATSMSALYSVQYLTSPNWPYSYRDNEECIWTLTAQASIMMVRIEVLDSQLEDQDTCGYDYVKVYDGNSTSANIIQIWCGLMVPTVQSSGRAMTLKFHSDGSNVFKGFRLKYYQTLDTYTCGGTLNADSDGQVITSPGYIYPGHYQNNMDCIWRISTLSGVIKLKVLDSTMEESLNCQYDYLQIYDGSTTASSLSAGKFCGTHEPTFISSGSSVTLNFVSDNSNTYRGFKIEFTGGYFSPCGETDLNAYSYSTDYITSPNYPLNYPSNADCTWKITAFDDDYVVSIDVITSNVEFSADCSYDYVEAFDGSDEFAKSLGRWCGTDLPSKHSSGQHMFIKFHTDGSNTNSGFKLSYTAEFADNFPDLDSVNVAAIIGGTVGGFIFLVMIIVIIAAAANRKPSRPVVTRVQDRRAPGNIYTVNQGPYETTVSPAGFQPPPPYYQVVSGEYSRAAGPTGAPPPYYQPAGVIRATGQPVSQPPHAPTGVITRVAGPPTVQPPNTQTGVNNGIVAPQSALLQPGPNTGIREQSAPAPTTVPAPAPTPAPAQQTLYPQQGVTSDTAPIVSQEEKS